MCAKIAFFCIPAHGHTNPTLEVVRELVDRGHQVWYYSYELFREKIQETGARFISCDRFDREQGLTKKERARISKDVGFSISVLADTTLNLDEMVMEDMKAFRPDCIVADSMAVWGKFAALKLGVPLVSSTTTFAFNQYSARIMKQSPAQLFGLICSMPRINREIKRLQERGYPVKNLLSILQNDNETDTIVYTSKAFQPWAETFSDKYAFVGPSIRPAKTQWVKEREKLVYISMGTVNNQLLKFYRNCVEAFREREYEVLISVGRETDPTLLGSLPEHIKAIPHVDQIAVLQQADVFLSHCGMNSVSESLYFGVPLVLYPQTAEQGGVARRVEELGAGRHLEKATPSTIFETVKGVMEEKCYRESAEKIAASFRNSGGAKEAADKIEQAASAGL